MYCNKCGAPLEEHMKFCNKCGAPVTENEPAESQGRKPPVEERFTKTAPNGNAPKKPGTNGNRKKTVIGILLAVVLAALIGGIAFAVWYSSDGQKMKRMLRAEQYSEAYEVYEKLSDEQKSEVQEQLIEIANGILERFNSGEMEYQEAKDQLGEFASYAVGEIVEIETQLENLNESKQHYANAQSSEASKDWEKAIEEYKEVKENDSNYETAQEKQEELKGKYKTDLIEKVNSFCNEGKYQEALNLLTQGGKILLEDADLKNLRTEAAAHLTEKTESDALAQAKEKADGGDYPGALQILSDAAKKVNASVNLTAAIEDYKEQYHQQLLAEADSYTQQGNYEQAIATLTQGINYFGEGGEIGNEFNEKIEEYKNKLPIALNKLTVVDKKNVAIGTREDVFGNKYSDVIDFTVNLWSMSESYIEYPPNGNYKYLSGTIFVSKSTQVGQKNRIRIYADEVLVYESGELDVKTEPFSFDVDIANARFVRIEAVSDQVNSGYACIAGPTLHN